jgi:hypothetical protein
MGKFRNRQGAQLACLEMTAAGSKWLPFLQTLFLRPPQPDVCPPAQEERPQLMEACRLFVLFQINGAYCRNGLPQSLIRCKFANVPERCIPVIVVMLLLTESTFSPVTGDLRPDRQRLCPL